MRSLIIQVPKGNGSKILEKVQQFEGKNISLVNGQNASKKTDVVFACISNGKIGDLIAALDALPETEITLSPHGVMPLYPPPNEAPQQVVDVESRSPIEIFLSGLQSIGSWKGFTGYATIAGIVVWIGLFTNTSFLLVGAMLIAPFAGPAMNTAIATARGDWKLLRRALLRYFVALLITIAGAFILSLILQQEVATSMMISQSQISSVALLLPLAAGAAGALNLVQSERDSLVSGAAAGMLIAASLAPPAGIVGMAMAIGQWQMAKGGLFLLLLQLVGINLSGSLVFKLFGLSAEGTRYNRGKKRVGKVSTIISLICLAVILFWQFTYSPNLQRSSTAQRATADIQKILDHQQIAALVQADVSFTRASIQGQNSLLCVLYVQKKQRADSSEQIKQQLTHAVQQGLLQRGYHVTPLVQVNVLEPPA